MNNNNEDDVIDHYAVLNIPDNATQSEIRKAYLKASRTYHPDKNLSNPERASKMFHHVLNAFNILGDAIKRKEYDYDCGVGETESIRSTRSNRSTGTGRHERASTADSFKSQSKKMSSAFASSFGSSPNASFESAVHSWDSMMNQLLEPVRRRSTKKIQKIFRGYRIRKRYKKQLKQLNRQKKQRQAWAREKKVLKKAQRRVEKEKNNKDRTKIDRRRRVKTAPNGTVQPHSAKGQLFGPAPPVPRRKPRHVSQQHRETDSKTDSKTDFKIDFNIRKPKSTSTTKSFPPPPTSPSYHPQSIPLLKKTNFQHIMSMVSAATCLQRYWRRILLRNQKLASIIQIQSLFRGAALRINLKRNLIRAINQAKVSARKKIIQRITLSVIAVQAMVRSRNSRIEMKRLALASTKIQCFVSYHLKKKRKMSMKKAVHIINCVKKVQSAARMWKGKRVARTKKIAKNIQCMLFNRKKSVILLQSFVRRNKTQKKYIQFIDFVIKIQNLYRARNKEKKERQQQIRSKDVQFVSNVVQVCFSLVDNCTTRKLQDHSVNQIITTWRSFTAFRLVQAMQKSRNQQRQQQQQLEEKKKEEKKKYNQKICVLQSATRNYLARKTVNELRHHQIRLTKAIVLQCVARCRQAHREMNAKKRKEKEKQKQKEHQMSRGAIEVQRIFRSYVARQSYKRRYTMCLKIQTFVRRISACVHVQLLQQQRFHTLHCIQIQSWYRSIQARNIIERNRYLKIQAAIKQADLQRKQWWQTRSHAAHQLQCAFRRYQRNQVQRQKKWLLHVSNIYSILKFRNIIATHRAEKWKTEHISMHAVPKKYFPTRTIKRASGNNSTSASNGKQVLPSKKIMLVLNAIGIQGNQSSPNRTRRQKMSTNKHIASNNTLSKYTSNNKHSHQHQHSTTMNGNRTRLQPTKPLNNNHRHRQTLRNEEKCT